MSEAGWIAIAGFMATLLAGLGGVLLGNWLQSKSAERQRKWQLEDERRERARAQLEKHLNLLKGYVDDSLIRMAQLRMLFSLKGDTQTRTNLWTELVQKSSAVIADIEAVPDETQLPDLLEKFNASLMGFIKAKNEEEIATAQKEAQKTATTINRRIDELLKA